MKIYEDGYTDKDRFKGCPICKARGLVNNAIYSYPEYRKHLKRHDIDNIIGVIIDSSKVYESD